MNDADPDFPAEGRQTGAKIAAVDDNPVRQGQTAPSAFCRQQRGRIKAVECKLSHTGMRGKAFFSAQAYRGRFSTWIKSAPRRDKRSRTAFKYAPGLEPAGQCR